MERRGFVKTLAAATLPWSRLSGTAHALEELEKDLAAAGEGASRWSRLRQEFQLKPGFAHFNTGSCGAAPKAVTEAVARYSHELEGDPVRNTFGGLGSGMEDVRRLAAEFLGADLSETALTRNTTEGMNGVATGIDWEPGDEVLTTNHEHGGGMVCWQHVRKHRGIVVKYLKMPTPLRDKDEFLDLLERHLTPRTRVCSLMDVDTITGLRYPLADVARITRPRGVLLVCDGAQSPGMLDVDVKALGVDTFASSSHKWMLAPKGSGLLYIRREVQDRVQPVFLYSGYGGYSASSGTRDVAGILGHGVAMEFHNLLGRDRVEARCRELSARLRGHLERIPRVRILTPAQPELCGGILTFSVDGLSAGLLARRLLEEHDMAVKVAQGTYAFVPDEGVEGESYNALRVSTHIYNDEADVDRLAAAVEEMVG